MPLAQKISMCAVGVFFLVGLVCGGWKYLHIRRAAQATAPEYVNISHRAGLMYAFSCLIVERMVQLSHLEDATETVCVALLLTYFVLAQSSYIIHAFLRDTENQLQRPHRLGSVKFSATVMSCFMISPFIAEVGAFATLFFGVIRYSL